MARNTADQEKTCPACQGTLSPRQGGGVGTGPAAASGAGGGYRRCMEGPGGPVTSAWRVIRATARARVQDSGCLIGRCARRRGAAGHKLPVIGPVYGHGVRLRVDPWVEVTGGVPGGWRAYQSLYCFRTWRPALRQSDTDCALQVWFIPRLFYAVEFITSQDHKQSR